MGLLTRLFEPRSGNPERPSTTLSAAADWLYEALGASTTAAGTGVSPKKALGISAVYRSIHLLAQLVGTLPIHVYERVARGKQRAPEHPLAPLLRLRPNPYMSAVSFFETLQGHAVGYGNGFAEIERNRAGRPIAFWPLPPDTTTVHVAGGRKYYATRVRGDAIELEADDVLHIVGFGFDGLQGYNPIRLMRESVGLSLATQEFGARFFGSGSRPSGVLETPKPMTKDAKVLLREQWQQVHGGLTNQHRVAILEDGLTFKPIGIPPEDAQFLETRKFQVAEVARMFGVPLHLLAEMDRTTHQNAEQTWGEFLVATVRPWLVRWEQALNFDALVTEERAKYFVEFSVEGLLRADSAGRAQFYKELSYLGALSPNDIREKENLNPIDGGDQYFVQGNMVPLDVARDVALKKGPTSPGATPREARDASLEANAAPRLLTAPAPDVDWGPLLRDVAQRMYARERVQAMRAAKKGREAFGEWVTSFYPDHREALIRAYRPAAEMLARALSPGTDPAVLAATCAAHAIDRATEDLRHALGSDDVDTAVASLLEAWDLSRVNQQCEHDVALFRTFHQLHAA